MTHSWQNGAPAKKNRKIRVKKTRLFFCGRLQIKTGRSGDWVYFAIFLGDFPINRETWQIWDSRKIFARAFLTAIAVATDEINCPQPISCLLLYLSSNGFSQLISVQLKKKEDKNSERKQPKGKCIYQSREIAADLRQGLDIQQASTMMLPPSD